MKPEANQNTKMKTTTEKNLLACTINHNDEPRRLKLVCRKVENEYQWFDAETIKPTGESGKTLEKAKRAAKAAWAGPSWNLKCNW